VSARRVRRLPLHQSSSLRTTTPALIRLPPYCSLNFQSVVQNIVMADMFPSDTAAGEVWSRAKARENLVLRTGTATITVFWDEMHCILEVVYLRFGGIHCFHLQGLLLNAEVVRSSEWSVNFYKTTRCHIAEESNTYLRRLPSICPRVCTLKCLQDIGSWLE
jgi:hypothetical protein